MFQNTSEQKLVQLVTIISILVNFLLTSLKLIVGITIGSTALIADGIDSLLDILTTIFAYIGVRIASKPPDEFHQYGHQKMEIFFSLGIFLIIFYSGSQIFLTALDRIFIGYELTFDLVGLVTALVSILSKLLLSYIVLKTGRKVNSPALVANAMNFRTDIFTSVLVAFTMVFAFLQLGFFDPIAAIIICLLIGYTGFTIFIEGWNILVDKAPPKEVVETLHSLAMSVPGVKEVHLIRARYLQGGIIGDLHILVDPTLTVLEGHAISEEVSTKLKSELNASMIAHLEPYVAEQRLANRK